MTDPIEQLAAALVDHRDNHPDDDQRTIRIWIDVPGRSEDQLYHRFSEKQIAKLAERIAGGQPKSKPEPEGYCPICASSDHDADSRDHQEGE